MAISRNALAGIAAVCAAALLTTFAAAQDQKALEKAAAARQGFMKLVSWDAGPILAMAKGDIPFDAEAATGHAENLDALVQWDLARLFVPGSSTEELGDKTRALPAIWEKPDEFAKAFQTLRERSASVLAAAGQGEEQFLAAAKELGQACGNCHENFRKKQ